MLRKQEQNARPPCSDESASDKMFKTIKKERTFFRPFANYEQPQPSSQNQQQQHQHQQHQRQNKSQAEKREDCFGIRCNHWHRERKNFSELVLWAEKHFFISSRHLSEHAQCLRLYEEKMKKRLELCLIPGWHILTCLHCQELHRQETVYLICWPKTDVQRSRMFPAHLYNLWEQHSKNHRQKDGSKSSAKVQLISSTEIFSNKVVDDATDNLHTMARQNGALDSPFMPLVRSGWERNPIEQSEGSYTSPHELLMSKLNIHEGSYGPAGILNARSFRKRSKNCQCHVSEAGSSTSHRPQPLEEKKSHRANQQQEGQSFLIGAEAAAKAFELMQHPFTKDGPVHAGERISKVLLPENDRERSMFSVDLRHEWGPAAGHGHQDLAVEGSQSSPTMLANVSTDALLKALRARHDQASAPSGPSQRPTVPKQFPKPPPEPPSPPEPETKKLKLCSQKGNSFGFYVDTLETAEPAIEIVDVIDSDDDDDGENETDEDDGDYFVIDRDRDEKLLVDSEDNSLPQPVAAFKKSSDVMRHKNRQRWTKR